jgi:hypothetical protein
LTDPDIELWYLDEMGVERDPQPQRRWAKKADKIRVPYFGAFDSPKQAFYFLWIEAGGEFSGSVKSAGAKGRIWHRHAWRKVVFKAN